MVAGDGSIDWLPLPELDSPSVFGAVLDAERGGRFALAPELPYTVERRYLPDTNVLETVFSTDGGSVRVTDAMTVPAAGLGPLRELSRRIEGLAGQRADVVERRAALRLRRRRDPAWLARPAHRSRPPGATRWPSAPSRPARPTVADGAIRGRFEAREGTEALIALCAAHQEPLVIPSRGELESRLDATAAMWRDWTTVSPTRARGATR